VFSRIPLFRLLPFRLLLLSAALLMLAALSTQAAPPISTDRVSVSSQEAQANGASHGTVGVSADGRYVVFSSIATNLGPDGTFLEDVFIRDRTGGFTQLVSLGNPFFIGGQREIANGPSIAPSVSGDGRFIAFQSDASNLVIPDGNGDFDIFVRDRFGGVVRVSESTLGVEGDLDSAAPSISANGRVIAFHSAATNLVAGDTNTNLDVFVHNRDTDQDGLLDEPLAVSTQRVSVPAFGGQAMGGGSSNASISADGRYVVFQSDATNLVGTDALGFTDVFVRDLTTGATTRLSEINDGLSVTEADGNSFLPAISADGRFVAFATDATNLAFDGNGPVIDIVVADRDADENGIYDEPGTILFTLVSVSTEGLAGDLDSGVILDPVFGIPSLAGRPAISGDGRYVLYPSDATTLSLVDFNGVTDVYIHDRDADGDGFFDDPGGVSTELASVGAGGLPSDGPSAYPAISTDGSVFAFESAGTFLVPNDTFGFTDIFANVIGVAGGSIGVNGNFIPIPDAGPDFDVEENDFVILDAGASFDQDGDPLTFRWRQLRGPRVRLFDPMSPTPGFEAPLIPDLATILEFEFEVSVSDSINRPVTDTVVIRVFPATGILTGVVLQDDGSPVAGVLVQVVRSDGQAATPAVTDIFGQFVIGDVRVGPNTVIVNAPGFDLATSEIVMTSFGLDEVFTLVPITTSLAGTVLGSDGEPLDGATVEVVDRNGNVLTDSTGFELSAITDDTGAYSIDAVPQAVGLNVNLRVRHPDAIEWVQRKQLVTGLENRLDFFYSDLEVVVDTRIRGNRPLLDNTLVEILINNMVVVSNMASQDVRRLTFRNLPAVRIVIRVTNARLGNRSVTTIVQTGPGTHTIPIRL
jgi:carboxypeptidase family protein/WD40 repeat protein